MLDSWQRLTFYPLRWISFGGLHPDTDSKFAELFFWCSFSFFALIAVLAAVQILLSYSGNIYVAIESILTIVLYLHMMSKYMILYQYRPTLKRLLTERSKFWKIEDAERAVCDSCSKSLKTAILIIKLYLTYSLCVVTSFLMQPVITGQLPVFFYVPDGWYYFLLCSFNLVTPAIMASIWGVDTTYYSISVPVSIQFRLLASEFETVNLNTSDRNTRDGLKRLVDHQNFLMRYCQEINKMFGGVFLTQFLVAIATSCMQLFIASQPEFGLMNKIKCLTYFTMQVIEIAIYTLTAEVISESSADVGNATYRSLWYEIKDENMKKVVVLVIERSQKKVVFNGLGLVRINVETFTQIFKTALSFYTYLNTMVYS